MPVMAEVLWNTERLRAFEDEIAEAFKAKKIRGPVHFSGGNEPQLIDLFRLFDIGRKDWVLCSYRSHYHALLKGIPAAEVRAQIMAGRSMNLSFPEHRFLTSAIVGGTLPIAVGIAMAAKLAHSSDRVFCFVGDMAASIGAFHDAVTYARGHELPLVFVVEDNGLACDTPTAEVWGRGTRGNIRRYRYDRKWPHVGVGTWVAF